MRYVSVVLAVSIGLSPSIASGTELPTAAAGSSAVMAEASASAAAATAPAPARRKESKHWRPILAAAGAVGGFATGVLLGIVMFDDDRHAEDKIWGLAAVLGTAGGAGGFLAGRALDQRDTDRTAERAIEEGRQRLRLALAERESSGGAVVLSLTAAR